MSRCQRRGTATRPSLQYDDFRGSCDSYFENEDSPWKLPPATVIGSGPSRTIAASNILKNRLSRLEERVARLESSKENLTGTGVEIKSFYTDPNDPSQVVGFVSGADRRFKFTNPISLPEAANLPNVDMEETKVTEAPTSLDAEPVVTPPEAPPFDAPPLISPGDLGISPSVRRRSAVRRSAVRRSPQPTLQEQIEMKRAGLRRVTDRPSRSQEAAMKGRLPQQEMSMIDALRGGLVKRRADLEGEEEEEEEDWERSPYGSIRR